MSALLPIQLGVVDLAGRQTRKVLQRGVPITSARQYAVRSMVRTAAPLPKPPPSPPMHGTAPRPGASNSSQSRSSPKLPHSIQPSHTAPKLRARCTGTWSVRAATGACHCGSSSNRWPCMAPLVIGAANNPRPRASVHPTAPLPLGPPCPHGAPSGPTASRCVPCRLCGDSCAANTTRHFPNLLRLATPASSTPPVVASTCYLAFMRWNYRIY